MNPLDNWETTVTAEDQAYYQQIYQYEGLNKSQTDMASFLRKAQAVSPQQLNQILGAAFQANTTNVDDNKKSFYIALKLIACAQHGINPSSPILSTSTPLPTFEDYEIITSKDRQKYLRIFQASGPTDGLINGDKAMKILMRSKLPVSLLSQIWNLADIDRQGKLDSTGFVIAMHYVARCMNGNQKSLPHANAPDSILISARGESPSLATMNTPKHSPSTGKPSSTLPPPPPPPSVSANKQPVQVTNKDADIFSPLHQQQPWTVDNGELASYKVEFEKIDTQHKGYIDGSEAVGFFGHSKLPSSDLAGIWDLADTQNRGQLSQDEFAIAMHLIRRIRGGSSLPSTLPATLLSHVNAGNQKALAKQVDQLEKSIEHEQKDVTTLQQSVKEKNSVVSDLQKQVDTLEQSLREVTEQKTDLQTTLETLKRTEDEKRHKIAQLEKEYNITQTELASLKAAHQQRLALVGISNSQLASAQSLKDKSAEELALAQSGKFDTISETSPKSNDAPPPPPPSSRHHRTQSLRSQQSPGSSNRKPPAPPPSKKKRAPVPSTLPSDSDTKVTTENEKALAAAVSTGVASVVASSVLTGLINSPAASTPPEDTSMKADDENDAVTDNVETTQPLPSTLTNAPTDDKEILQDDAATLDSPKVIDEGDVEKSDNNSNALAPPTDSAQGEPKTDGELATAPIKKGDSEDIKDSSLNENVDDSTNDTQPVANLTPDAEASENAKPILSDINVTQDASDAKEETTEATTIANETTAKDSQGETDSILTKNVPSEANGPENTTVTTEAPKEITKNADNTTDTQQKGTIAGENSDTTVDAAPSLPGIDDTTHTTETPVSAETGESKDVTDERTTSVDNLGDEKEQETTASQDQSVTTTTPEMKKEMDMTSAADVPNGPSVIIEPVGSGNKQSLTDGSRTLDDTNTGSPEILTATTTASGSLKGDDHDFEVVDNASASSSFMSASMGADDDAIDEFDAAFSETLPDAKMVLSNTTSGATGTSSSNTATSGYDKHLYDDDDFDEAFDPKVFTPTKATTHFDQQPDLSRQMDSSQAKNDPFAVHDTDNNDNSFADAFAPFDTKSSQKDASANVSGAFDDSFTVPQSHTSTDSTAIATQNEPAATNSLSPPEFTDLKDLVVSPEQIAEYESNPFDEPSVEHRPEDKDQQDVNLLDTDRPIANQPFEQQTSEQLPRQSTIGLPPAQLPVEQFTQPSHVTTQPIEHSSVDNIERNPQQPPTAVRQDISQANLGAPPTVSPSISTTSNAQSDRQSQQSQQSQQRPPAGTKSADEAHSSKGKHKGLFSLSSMLPKQKGKKSKSKSSKKDKSGGGHEAPTQPPPPPQSPTTMQHYQDPSLENAVPAMSDQEVMANLRDFGIDSESMKTLTNMGFTVDQAKEALERYDYDVQKATNFLLDQ